MPSKNIIKNYREDSFFHVYNRGVNKESIFLDETDKNYFLSLFDRYLNPNNMQVDYDKILYKKFNVDIEIICFCIMDNHYHFLIWLGQDTSALAELMRAIGTSYTRYYNDRYNRVGPLFQSRFKASEITSEAHLIHMTRYIHLNPKNYMDYKFSSLNSYIGENEVAWLKPQRILKILRGIHYLQFLKSA